MIPARKPSADELAALEATKAVEVAKSIQFTDADELQGFCLGLGGDVVSALRCVVRRLEKLETMAKVEIDKPLVEPPKPDPKASSITTADLAAAIAALGARLDSIAAPKPAAPAPAPTS
jgi:hypothetical protein